MFLFCFYQFVQFTYVPVPSLSVSGVKRADGIRLERILGVVKVGEAVSGQKLLARTLQ